MSSASSEGVFDNGQGAVRRVDTLATISRASPLPVQPVGKESERRYPGNAPGDFQFFGREYELAEFAHAFDDVCAGTARIVLVCGDAGAGKSSLVGQAIAQFAGAARVAAGGCVDIPGVDAAQVPFGPFVEVLRRLHRTERQATTTLLLDAWLNPTAPKNWSDHVPTQLRSAALLPVLDRLSQERPLVLVLEDLHWADDSSLALLVFLARNLTTEPVLIVVTTRTHLRRGSAAQATFDHLLGLPLASRIALDPLPDQHVRSIIVDSASDELPEAHIAAIVTRAEGNPFAARELASNPRPQNVGPEEAWLPAALTASVHRRIHRCTPDGRAVLAAAAILGDLDDSDILDHMLGAVLPDLDHNQRLDAISGACETGLLRPIHQGYRFRHGLDRDAIYSELWPDERRRLHIHAAEALAQFAPVHQPDIAARIAGHWHSAGDRDRARSSALIAARSATDISAFPEALVHYERVLALWPCGITTKETNGGPGAELLLEIAGTALWGGEVERCLELALHAVELAETADMAGMARVRLAEFIRTSGDSSAAIAACKQAQAMIMSGDGAPSTAAILLAIHAASLVVLGRYAEAIEVASEVLESTIDPDDQARSSALISLGLAVALTGEAETGLELLRQGRGHAVSNEDTRNFWRAEVNISHVLNWLGKYQLAADALAESLRTGPVGPRVEDRGIAAMNAAESLFWLGQWQQADNVLQEGLTRSQSLYEVGAQLALQGRIKLLMGDVDDARSLLAAADSRAATVTDPETVASICVLRAELALADADEVTARHAIGEAIAIFAPIDEDPQLLIEVLAVAAHIEAEFSQIPGLRDVGRLTQIHELLTSRSAHLQGSQAHAGIEAKYCAAELAHARAHDDETMWKAIADAAQDLQRPYLRGLALLRLAEAAVRARHRGPARPALVEAHRISHGLGARPLVARVLQFGSQIRVTVEPTPATPHTPPPKATRLGLTPREIEVLHLVAQGCTNRQIGSRLDMAEKTASVHVSRILAKFGASTRGEAAAAALRLHLLDP